jgi:hypothetical protein
MHVSLKVSSNEFHGMFDNMQTLVSLVNWHINIVKRPHIIPFDNTLSIQAARYRQLFSFSRYNISPSAQKI